MRVIGGKYRGFSLYEFKGQAIRPTSDRAREAVFNILQSRVRDGVCLDLFCGTGSLGIEALSRGAREVVFVDHAKESVLLTKKNLSKVRETAAVHHTDALAFLSGTDKKFDVVFIDPPYASPVSESAVKKIVERDLLTENGVIVFERDAAFAGTVGAVVYDVRKYGKGVFSFIRKEKKCLFAGTFDPLTKGHEAVVERALEKYDRVVVTVMNNPAKTPMFSVEARLDILRNTYRGEDRVAVDHWDGYLVDYMKAKGLRYNVRGVRNEADLAYEKEMEAYNVERYPEMQYDYIYTDRDVSSTAVRAALREGKDCSSFVNAFVSEEIDKIRAAEAQKKG